MRQADEVKGVFAQGVETWLDLIGDALEADHESGADARRALSIDLAARAVGAIILSRVAATNPELSDEILQTCLSEALAAAASGRLSRG